MESQCTVHLSRNTEMWNAGIPHDTIAGDFTDGAGWGGAVALTQNGNLWQSLVRLADGFTLGGILHELGHVLGKASPAIV
jgi:hypothetical protein